jgi:guanylate kinase
MAYHHGYRSRIKPWKLEAAKRMRNNPTAEESVMWKYLRCDGAGVKFRRQAPMLGWIVDFWCPSRRLVVEIDGGYHETPERQAKDALRDERMREMGVTVLRIPNADVRSNPQAVFDLVRRTAAGLRRWKNWSEGRRAA